MRLRIYYDSTQEPLDSPANDGIANSLALLKRVERKGVACD